MCEYQRIIRTEKGTQMKCIDGTICLFCIFGNAKKYKELKEKGVNPNEIK